MDNIDKRVYLALLYLYARSNLAKDEYMQIVEDIVELSDQQVTNQIEQFTWHKAIVRQFMQYSETCKLFKVVELKNEQS